MDLTFGLGFGVSASKVLRPLRGWAGPPNCTSQDLTKVSVPFSQNVIYTSDVNGVTITHNNGGIFTIVGTTGSGTKLLEYTGSWNIAPDAGNIFTYDYNDTLGDYRDGDDEQMGSYNTALTNCASAGTWLNENSEVWENELAEAWTTE